MEISKINIFYFFHKLFFFVSYRMLILGGTLDLIYGRRYGFVGRNGLGKSTLLRVMAK
jgi:ATPase subunit of ABC transporter with duplicated ATPase domains